MLTKRVIAGVLAALVFSAAIRTPVFAKEPFIKIDGMYEVLKITPAESEGLTLVALQEVFGLIGASYSYDPYSNVITAHKGKNSLTMKVGYTKATLNDNSVEMPLAPVMIRETVMLPLVFISESLGCNIQYDKDKNLYSIKTGRGDLTTLNINYKLSDSPEYTTFDEALTTVIAANSTLKDLDQTVKLLEETRDKTIKAYRDTPNTGSIIPAINFLRGINTLDIQALNIPLSEQIIKDSSQYLLISAVSKVAQAQIDLQLLEQNSKLQDLNVRNLKLKESLGMASANDLTKAQQDNQQTKSNLSVAGITLDKEMASLKSLLNKNMPHDIVVSHSISYPALTDSVETYVSIKKLEAPTLKIKKNSMAEAEYNLKTHNDFSRDMKDYAKESTIEKQNAYDKAVRDYSDTEKAIDTTVRSTYNSVKQLIERQNSLDIDLQKARDTYNTTISSFDAGMITIYEVDMAKFAISYAEAAIIKNKYSIWALMFLLEHPYLSNS